MVRTVALVSDHACPAAQPGGADAGGQNVYVAGLATELGRRGIDVTVYTRRTAPHLAPVTPFAPGVVIAYVDAGPAHDVPKDELPPYMPAFGRALRAAWVSHPP